MIGFEVSLINWLEDGKENKECKNKMEMVMTLECVCEILKADGITYDTVGRNMNN